MKEQRRLNTCQGAKSESPLEVAQCQEYGDRGDVLEVAEMEGQPQEWHRCDRDFNQPPSGGPGLETPTVWPDRTEPVGERPEQHPPLLLLFVAQRGAPEVVGPCQRPQK